MAARYGKLGVAYNVSRHIHTLTAEKALGKPLPFGAEVHHVNENKFDNRPENLVICPNHAYHMLLHRRTKAVDAGYPADYRQCRLCKQFDAPENLRLYDGMRNNGYSNNEAEHARCRNLHNSKRI